MLELNNIDAAYGAFQALFGVSMKVEAGEAVAVVGANGAGKTTLLRVISGLLPAASGTMAMQGTSLRAIAPHKIIETGIAHVAEGRRLFPASERRGQSQDGRLHPGGAQPFRRAARLRLWPLPAPQGAPRAARRHLVGRRAADVRHRAGADERTQARAPRRAVDGLGAGHRPAGVRSRAAHPLGGLHGAHRRAECSPSAQGRGSRLSHRGRPHQDERAAGDLAASDEIRKAYMGL